MTFDCPRCGKEAEQETYGPCPSCRGQLRAKYEYRFKVQKMFHWMARRGR